MNVDALIDPAVSGRLSLMLLHSLWQVALLSLAAWSVTRLLRLSVSRSYTLHVAALALSLAAMPVTYLLIAGPAIDQEAPAPAHPVSNPPPPAAEAPVPIESTPLLEPTFADVGTPPVVAAERVPSADQSDVVAPVEQQTAKFQSLTPWIVLLYCGGVCAMLGRLILSVMSARRLVRRSSPVTDAPLVERFRSLARRCSVSLAPALARADQITVPKVVGLLKPTVLLPSAAASGLTPEQLEMVLVHELIHLRRHDLWVNLLQRAAEVVLFFNPALWYLSRRISTLREYCCDEATCRMMTETVDEPRTEYALALLRIAELSQPLAGRIRRKMDAGELATLAAGGRSPSELRRRVARLFGEPIREPLRLSRGSLSALCAVVLAVVFGSSMWPARAQTKESETEADPAKSIKDRVEVVAIGTHNERSDRWWNASGEVIESPPFEWTEGHDVSGDERQWGRVVVRVHDLADDDKVSWEIVGRPDSWGASVTVDGKKDPRGYFTQQFVIPEGQRNLSLRVGVASGEWKTAVTFGPNMSFGHGRANDKSLVSSGALTNEDGTVVVISHNYFDQNFRVVAVDKQGRKHSSTSTGGVSAGKIYQTRATFPEYQVKPDEIARFEFQVREYESVEINNLPLQPRAGGDALGRESPREDKTQNYEFPISVSGRAFNEQGQPIAGAKVVLVSRSPGYRRIAETKTDQSGNYRFDDVALPIEKADTVAGKDVGTFEVFGLADGYALAWRPKKGFYTKDSHRSQSNPQDSLDPERISQFGRDDPISLDLTFRPSTTIRGRVVDDQGQPIPNTKLAIRGCKRWWDPTDDRLSILGCGLESLNSTSIVPLELKTRTTSDDGRFEFNRLPADYHWRIDVRPSGHPPRMIWAVTRDGVHADERGNPVFSGDFDVVFPSSRKMRFRVVDEKTAEPLSKVGVGGKVSDIGFWETTDEEGLLEVNLPDGEFTITMFPRFGTSYWRTESDVTVSEETAQAVNVLRLHRAAVVELTVLDDQSRKPLPGVDVWLEKRMTDSQTPYRDVHGYRSWEVETRLSRHESPRTDAEGKMRVLFEPGKHRIGIGKEAYPRGYMPVEPDGKEIECEDDSVTAVEFLMKNIESNRDAEPRAEITEPDRSNLPESTVAKLADGTTVRLLGVSNNRDRRLKLREPSSPQEWWKPDGTQLKEPPYAQPGLVSNHETAYEFAF